MGKNDENIFNKASKGPDASDIFAIPPVKGVSAEDVFDGDEKTLKALNKKPAQRIVEVAADNVSSSAKRFFTATHIILIINILVLTGILVYLVARPQVVTIQGPVAAVEVETPDPTVVDESVSAKSLFEIDVRTAETLDEAASLQMAETLFKMRDYEKAFYVYQRLADNLTSNIPADEFLKDYMHLRMALCLQQSGDQTELSKMFNVSLNSKSPVVRAMANYYLIFVEAKNKQYLKARRRAYKTLSLLKAFEDSFSPMMEADCYFVIAESLTRHILLLTNASDELPGKMWLDSLRIETIPMMTQQQLRSFLQSGVYQLSEGALTPQLKLNKHASVGSQWTAITMETPIEEMISHFAAGADLNISWENTDEAVRRRPVTIYLPGTSSQFISEFSIGSTGLIAQMQDDEISIYDPDQYDDLREHKRVLIKEAISVWRRFPLRYRGDHRTANAHYAMGLLFEKGSEYVAALGSYKLLASNYSNNPLAPYALLNSSTLKTDMKNYTGAKNDLTELLTQYPDTVLADQATLHLATATMRIGNYKDAMRLFKKVYNINLNNQAQRDAAYGLANCYYLTRDHPQAQKWITLAIKLTSNSSDHRLPNAYFMLGKTNIKLKEFEKASAALKNALSSTTPDEEYLNIIINLVEAEVKQGKYVVALNILENVPIEQLAQELACKVLIAKAVIMRDIELVDASISMLRRKIEFIADPKLRALLSFELAKSYVIVGDLDFAKKELIENLTSLPADSDELNMANIMLIDSCMKLKNYDQARYAALQYLNSQPPEKERKQVSNMLGRIYTKLDQLDKAALAYAGIFARTGVAQR